MVASAMFAFDEILQYQLIQESATEYRLRVSGARGTYTEDEFRASLVDLLGADAHFSVDFVESVPRDKGGKSRTVVGKYTPPGVKPVA